MSATYPHDKLADALGDPALEKLADGPAKELLTWLATEGAVGYYPPGMTVELQLVRHVPEEDR